MGTLQASSRLVIVGAGHAGVHLAVTLRDLGYAGDLLLLNGEGAEPYDRPTLSKDFLASADHPPLALRSASFFAEANVQLEQAAVTGLDPQNQRVVAEDGRSWACDHVVIATGGRPRRLTIPGAELAGVRELRTLADAYGLRAHLQVARRLVVIGGGFIGLEIAAAARAHDLDVVVVEAQQRLMERAVSEDLAAAALDHHQASGTKVMLGRQVVALAGDGSASAVILDDGTSLDADLVVVGVGMATNDQLARAAGLDVDQGIIVDELLGTSDPWISAIGDCAVVRRDDGRRQRLESISNAHAQARTLAERLLGEPLSPPPAPWFWSHQGKLKLQMVGRPATADHYIRVGDSARFSVLGFHSDVLSVVESVNDPGTHLAARRIMDQPKAVSLAMCQEHEFDLRHLARQSAASPTINA